MWKLVKKKKFCNLVQNNICDKIQSETFMPNYPWDVTNIPFYMCTFTNPSLGCSQLGWMTPTTKVKMSVLLLIPRQYKDKSTTIHRYKPAAAVLWSSTTLFALRLQDLPTVTLSDWEGDLPSTQHVSWNLVLLK